MKSKKCPKCDKIIEGFTDKHVDTLMAQHMIKHQNEDKVNGRTKKEKKVDVVF